MEKEAETKKELIEDVADLRQQPADVKKSRSETKNSLQALQASETDTDVSLNGSGRDIDSQCGNWGDR